MNQCTMMYDLKFAMDWFSSFTNEMELQSIRFGSLTDSETPPRPES